MHGNSEDGEEDSCNGRNLRSGIGHLATDGDCETERVAQKVMRGGSRPALRREDAVWSRTQVHRDRVAVALDAVAQALEIGRIGVSFSGGKDSTATLDLVRQRSPDAPAAIFDTGAELRTTLDLAERLGVERFHPLMSMLDMARYAGWWGHEAVDPTSDFDVRKVTLQDPCEAFAIKRALRVVAYGIRAEESKQRKMHVRCRGELFQTSYGMWFAMPCAAWRVEDVWAYIAARGLDYNAAYDVMSAAGVPRSEQRVSGILGEDGASRGKHEYTRLHAPEDWAAMVREFPLLGVGT